MNGTINYGGQKNMEFILFESEKGENNIFCKKKNPLTIGWSWIRWNIYAFSLPRLPLWHGSEKIKKNYDNLNEGNERKNNKKKT